MELTEQQVRDIVKAEISSYASGSMYDVAKVPFHTHNGTDAPLVNVDTTITSAEVITALGYTPEDVANKKTSTALGTSDTFYPTQNAVKVYADAITTYVNTKFLSYLASNDLIYSGQADFISKIATVATKVIQFKVMVGGTIRINWTLNQVTGDSAYSKIYRNIDDAVRWRKEMETLYYTKF